MEMLHTFWIMMMTSMIKMVLAQSDVESTRIEKIASMPKDLTLETINTVLNNETKARSQGSEGSKDFTFTNLETRISNEINLESNSSEELIVKRSTVRVQSTETPSVGLTGSEIISTADNFDGKLTTLNNEMGKTLASLSDLLLQSHSDVTVAEESGKGVIKETSLSNSSEAEPAMTEIPAAEALSPTSFDSNVFSNGNAITFKTLKPLYTEENLNIDSTSSGYSNADRGQTVSVDFSTLATEFLSSRSFKNPYSDFETSDTDGSIDETPKTESLPEQSTNETFTSLTTTEVVNLGSKYRENDFLGKDFEEEQSESRHSLNTESPNDSAFHGNNGYGSTSKSETPPEQLITNNPLTYTFREDQNTQGLGFKMNDSAAEEVSFTVDEEVGEETIAESSTQKSTDDRTTSGAEKPTEDESAKVTIANDDKQFRESTEIAVSEAAGEISEGTVTELHERREDITQSSSEIWKSTDDTENNSTRIPKRIQEPRYTEARYRPRPPRPDPGYSYGDDRPYRPDDLLYSRGPKPGVDSYTPLRRESDFSRPARPDPYIPGSEFSRHAPDYSRQSPDSGIAKPYRPQTSFSRPYVPQGSFGRPYRPDRDHTKNVSPPDYYSKTTEEFPSSSKPDNVFFGASQSETDFSESSHSDDYDGKTSEASEFEYQRPHSDVKPMVLTPDVFKPYRPQLDTRVSPDREDVPRPLRPVYLPSSSTMADSDVSKVSISELSSKPASRPDVDDVEDTSPDSSAAQGTKSGEKSKPSGSYPRPGFGSNYGQPIGTSPKPFTPGTITLARNNLTRVEYIKADCFDNHMKVSIRFNGSFNGLVYSSGYSQDPTCSYINGSGRYHYEFFIRLNRCGTLGKQEVGDQRIDPVTRRRQDRAQYLVNTVTVQYNPVIEEEIDEHFRVTCEYGYDFWKTVTFPVVSVETYLSRSSALKVRTGSPVVFTLPPPQCNMEIRAGYGPSGSRVSGPVNVGDPLTLVIHMKSESAGFDILVSNCFAHNGAQKRLQLIDSNGCVVQEKLVSPFRGVSSPNRSQQVTLYSYLKAFRFTGSPALYIECDVHMCHGSCPPQRCYWRHLYKRSVENETDESITTTVDPVISESVSLFQSLEVRNVESDRPNSLAVSSTDGHPDEDIVCFRAAGFAAILASLLVVLVVTCFTSICLCSRIRKMKTYFESTDTKDFIQFDINTQRK